jgi:hypothetical protein
MIKGEHCLVKWKVCTHPRKWGGLGIKDLDKFERALRLHWLWHQWDTQERPWKELLRHQDKTDRALFFASTLISVSDGKSTPFWESIWLEGVSPKELAPNLYKQARFKYRTVHTELRSLNWIKNLRQVNMKMLMDEFILLFMALSEIQTTDQKDSISWKWIPDGVYLATSAYKAQFLGAFPLFRASSIWQTKTEPKCRFFAWLAVLGKAPTTDNLLKKN